MHVDSPPIPLIKIKHDDKSDKDFVQLKFHRYTMSEGVDLYKHKMALFDNGEPEEFLLFICNFNMNLEASGTLDMSEKFQYLHTLVCGELLRQFDIFFLT